MLVSRITATIVASLLIGSASAGTVAENEKLVMRLVFDDCLGYVRDDRTPFVGLSTKPASAEAITDLPDQMRDRERAVELMSPRYVAAWGADHQSRHCMVMTVSDARERREPALLGVRAAGFVERMTERAVAEGLTEGEHGPEFLPLVSSYWSEPDSGAPSGPDRPISVTMLPTDGADGGDMVDAGLIVMGGPLLPRDRVCGVGRDPACAEKPMR